MLLMGMVNWTSNEEEIVEVQLRTSDATSRKRSFDLFRV